MSLCFEMRINQSKTFIQSTLNLVSGKLLKSEGKSSLACQRPNNVARPLQILEFERPIDQVHRNNGAGHSALYCSICKSRLLPAVFGWSTFSTRENRGYQTL